MITDFDKWWLQWFGDLAPFDKIDKFGSDHTKLQEVNSQIL